MFRATTSKSWPFSVLLIYQLSNGDSIELDIYLIKKNATQAAEFLNGDSNLAHSLRNLQQNSWLEISDEAIEKIIDAENRRHKEGRSQPE